MVCFRHKIVNTVRKGDNKDDDDDDNNNNNNKIYSRCQPTFPTTILSAVRHPVCTNHCSMPYQLLSFTIFLYFTQFHHSISSLHNFVL